MTDSVNLKIETEVSNWNKIARNYPKCNNKSNNNSDGDTACSSRTKTGLQLITLDCYTYF